MADVEGSPGDSVLVDFNVTNTGEATGTQDILFEKQNGGTVSIDQLSSLTLDPSQSTSDQFRFDSDPNSDTVGDLVVRSEDSEDRVSIYLSDIPQSGVSRWDFTNSNSDTSVAVDEWDSNNGTVSGATHLASGGPDANGAYSFDGTDDYISVGSPTNLIQSPFSVSALARFDTLGNTETLFSHIEENPTEGWELAKNGSDQAELIIGDSDTTNTVSGSTALSTDTWYLLTGTYDGTNITVYVDDAEDGTASGPFDAQASGTSTGDTRIGYSTSFSANPMAGDIARVDYYSEEVTAQEVANLRATGSING